MTVKKTDRESLLENACKLFRNRGYGNTSIADIAQACNLSKGSVYHYIKSKHELVLEVLQRQLAFYNEHLFNIANQDDLSINDRINHFADKIKVIYQQQDGRCIIVQLALESVEVLPEIKSIFQQFYNQWLDALVSLLSAVIDKKQATIDAKSIVSEIHGALLFSFSLSNDDASLQQAIRRLKSYL